MPGELLPRVTSESESRPKCVGVRAMADFDDRVTLALAACGIVVSVVSIVYIILQMLP